MNSDDTGKLIYLILLGLMICSWLFSQKRLSLNKSLQHAVSWGLLFLGAIAAYGLWDDIRQTVLPQQAVFAEQGKIVVPRSADGHYHLAAEVNGTALKFVLDTGATEIVLTRSDAEAVGLSPDDLNFTNRAMTANGQVATARVQLDTVRLGPITDRGVNAVVNGGDMSQSLLGMTYLQRWGKIEISGGELTLTR